MSCHLRGDFAPEGCYRIRKTEGHTIKEMEELGPACPDVGLDDMAAKLPSIEFPQSIDKRRVLPLCDQSNAEGDAGAAASASASCSPAAAPVVVPLAKRGRRRIFQVM